MTRTYQFNRQLVIGEANERRLDSFFSAWYTIAPVSRDDQRRGIDRRFVRRRDGARYAVEYKTDYTAARTGNAFVETVSVDTYDKPGWVYTSTADILLYYVPGKEQVYIWRMAQLRRRVEQWRRLYPQRAIPNRGYRTHGVLVPLSEFERCADQVIQLE